MLDDVIWVDEDELVWDTPLDVELGVGLLELEVTTLDELDVVSDVELEVAEIELDEVEVEETTAASGDQTTFSV